MQKFHYIAMDLAVSHTTFESQTRTGSVICRRDLPTERGALIEAVQAVPRPRGLVFEEGTLADWVFRFMRPHLDDIVVCDPRRNRLISDGDKEDTVDAAKLCELYRLGALRKVHHPIRRTMIDQRRWVWLYLDQVRLTTALKNRIKAAYRFNGIFCSGSEVYQPEKRRALVSQLPSLAARRQVSYLYDQLDLGERIRNDLYLRLDRTARRHPVVRRFLKIPGIGPVYGMTFWVTVDTPWRFRTVKRLWAYAGLGIHRYKSGKAKPNKPYSNGPEHLNWPFNPHLKNMAKGAALQAIKGDNPFAAKYEELIAKSVSPGNARSTIARKCLAVAWAMWKNGQSYKPQLV